MTVLISRKAPQSPQLDTRAVRRMAERMLRLLKRESAELSLLLTSDVTMRLLNREYRQLDKPTDVLAYPLLGDGTLDAQQELLGDVVISLDTAQRQARLQGHPLEYEVCLLLAHGLLHLLGYDHHTVGEERVMNAKQSELVRAAMATGTSIAAARQRTQRGKRSPPLAKRPSTRKREAMRQSSSIPSRGKQSTRSRSLSRTAKTVG